MKISKRAGRRPRQDPVRLARQPPLVLVRRIPRPRAHGLPRPARDQRRLDRARPGFGQHPHRDAEILSYVLDGQLQHRDSMGNGSVIAAGDLQYMSAGNGVLHSEFNPSRDERAHLLQIWILPDQHGGDPRYAEKALGDAAKPNALTLLFSGNPRDGAVAIRADADVYVGKLDAGERVAHRTSSRPRRVAAPDRGDDRRGRRDARPGRRRRDRGRRRDRDREPQRCGVPALRSQLRMAGSLRSPALRAS